MYIMVAGPYSAPTAEEREANLKKINQLAARIAQAGHIPVVGVNLALPIVEAGNFSSPYEEIMRISLAIAERCDAFFYQELSPGVKAELEVFKRKGLPIYNDFSQLPEA